MDRRHRTETPSAPSVGFLRAVAAQRLVVSLALLLGFALRLSLLGDSQLRLDGLTTVGVALLDLSSLVAFSLHDVHPPLVALALGRWLDVLGPGFLVEGWPSVAAGTLALALTYRLAAELFSPSEGRIAIFLLAFTPAAVLAGATTRDFAAGHARSLAT